MVGRDESRDGLDDEGARFGLLEFVLERCEHTAVRRDVLITLAAEDVVESFRFECASEAPC